jgi:hypothetical protein
VFDSSLLGKKRGPLPPKGEKKKSNNDFRKSNGDLRNFNVDLKKSNGEIKSENVDLRKAFAKGPQKIAKGGSVPAR